MIVSIRLNTFCKCPDENLSAIILPNHAPATANTQQTGDQACLSGVPTPKLSNGKAIMPPPAANRDKHQTDQGRNQPQKQAHQIKRPT